MREKKDYIRENIIIGAEKEFFKNGFSGSTTRDIAKSVGISYGNMYKYFNGKEKILEAVMGHYARTALKGFSEHLAHDPNLEFSQKITNGFAKGLVKLFEISRSKFIIFFSGMKGSKLDNTRKQVIDLLSKHIEVSINNPFLSKIITNNLISAIVELAKEYKEATKFQESTEKYISYHMAGISKLV